MPKRRPPMDPDLVLLIRAQAGVVARWQLREHGTPDSAVRTLIQARRWAVRYPGVCATVNGDLARAAELWAAVLACSRRPRLEPGVRHSPDAVLSHETAAELYGLADRPSAVIHVTVPDGRRRPVAAPGIRVHFSAHLADRRHPAQSPPRTRVEDTVLDLTQTAPDLDTAIDWLSRACGSRLTTPERLAAALRARRKVRHRRELQYALEDADDGAHNLFELRYYREVERAHGLPAGSRQIRRSLGEGTIYDDVDYGGHATVVHLDGRIHRHETRFRDMSRDNAAVVEGRDPLRYGWRDVTERPCHVAAQVALVLRRNGWAGWPRPCPRPGCLLRHIAEIA
ncbi:hypothetical protein [Actinoallomurus liliacearum]